MVVESVSELYGQVAIAIGASSGIGTATVLASRGASVVFAARRENELEALADQIESDGGDVPDERR